MLERHGECMELSFPWGLSPADIPESDLVPLRWGGRDLYASSKAIDGDVGRWLFSWHLEKTGSGRAQMVMAGLEFDVELSVTIVMLRLQGLWSVSVFVCVRSACMCCCYVLRMRKWRRWRRGHISFTCSSQCPCDGTPLGMLLPSSGAPNSCGAAASSMVLKESAASARSSSGGKSYPYALVSEVSTEPDLLILLREDCSKPIPAGVLEPETSWAMQAM